MISPLLAFTTSRGIFSPSRTLESESVSCSMSPSLLRLWSSPMLFSCRLVSAGVSFSRETSRRDDTFTSITMPYVPEGTVSDVSFTSAAFSPKMARSSRSSGASSVSLFGVIFPTKISPGFTSAPTRTTPSGPKLRKASSLTLGISRVISSGPNFVSRAPISNSSM
jgi:hypothetical protein